MVDRASSKSKAVSLTVAEKGHNKVEEASKNALRALAVIAAIIQTGSPQDPVGRGQIKIGADKTGLADKVASNGQIKTLIIIAGIKNNEGLK